MKVLICSQFFDPEPVPKGLAFARAIAAQGHDVEVLTGFPNYPGGRIYDGFRLRAYDASRTEDGIRVHRCWLYPSHDRSAVRRMANYGSFAMSATVLGALKLRRPDVIFAYHPPLTISIPALILSRRTGARLVYEIQDMWPDTLKATGMLDREAWLAFIDRWCRFVYRRADAIVVISEGFRRMLLERGVPASKVEVIYNWCEEGRIKREARDPALARELGLDPDAFTVLFAGTMGMAQGLDRVLDAAAISLGARSTAQYVFVGGGVESARLRAQAEARGLDNVVFVPRQPIENMGRILALADALLVHLRDDPLFAVTIPSKTQAYLHAGTPVLMAMRGDAANLIETAEAGLVVPPDAPDQLADAVATLAATNPERLAAMGQAGRAFYDRELSMRVGVQKYCDLFRRLVTPS
ncbi:MAG: glycosyltransferase family 4 protein [Myxococcota bacterium]